MSGELGSRKIDNESGLTAHTEFRALQNHSDGTTLLEARPLTGRTNQIRIHLSHLGFPIVGDVIVQIDPRYYRPTEVETLLGDPTKAKEKLGWVPEITLDQMIVEMVASDLDKAKQHALLLKHGHSVAVGKEN